MEKNEILECIERLEKYVIEIFRQHKKLGSNEMARLAFDELLKEMQNAGNDIAQELSFLPTMASHLFDTGLVKIEKNTVGVSIF